MAHLPYRFGLKTIRTLLRKVCSLAVKYRPLWVAFLTPEQVGKLDALVAACEPVIELIDLLYAYPA